MPTRLVRAIAHGTLNFGKVSMPCHVLEDGRRVIELAAIKRSLDPDVLPSSYREGLTPPSFRVRTADGDYVEVVEAPWLVDVANAFLAAYVDRALHEAYRGLAETARWIVVETAVAGLRAISAEMER